MFSLPLLKVLIKIGIGLAVVLPIFIAKFSKKPPREIKYVTEQMVIDDEGIDTLIGNGEAYRAVEPMFWNVSVYDGEEKYLQDLKSFSPEQRYVFAITSYESEVNNGGHDQFYFNSSGLVWQDAMNGFKELGLTEYYDVIDESAKRLGGNPSKDRIERQEQLEKLKPVTEGGTAFDDLDDKFYKLSETQPLDKALASYIQKHKNKFHFNGQVTKPDIPPPPVSSPKR